MTTCPACGVACRYWSGWDGMPHPAHVGPAEWACDHCGFSYVEDAALSLSAAIIQHRGACWHTRVVCSRPRFSIAAVPCKKLGSHFHDGHWYCHWHKPKQKVTPA